MIHHVSKALYSTRTATLQELLDEGWLNRTEHSRFAEQYQCTDDRPRPVVAGGWAACLRCELLAASDPRHTIRASSSVEIVIEAQVRVKSLADLIHWD